MLVGIYSNYKNDRIKNDVDIIIGKVRVGWNSEMAQNNKVSLLGTYSNPKNNKRCTGYLLKKIHQINYNLAR